MNKYRDNFFSTFEKYKSVFEDGKADFMRDFITCRLQIRAREAVEMFQRLQKLAANLGFHFSLVVRFAHAANMHLEGNLWGHIYVQRAWLGKIPDECFFRDFYHADSKAIKGLCVSCLGYMEKNLESCYQCIPKSYEYYVSKPIENDE